MVKEKYKMSEKGRKYMKEYYRKYRQIPEKREQMDKKHKEYYEKHKDKILKNIKIYNKKNKEQIEKKRKEHYKKNSESIKANYRAYYAENKEKKKKYYKENKEKIKKYYVDNKEILKTKRYNNFEKICKAKIQTYKVADKKYKREYKKDNYVSIEWIKQQLLKQNNKCHYCKKQLLLKNFQNNKKDQFSVDRIDNSIAHIKTNCVICCCGCNYKKNTMDYIDYIKIMNKKTIFDYFNNQQHNLHSSLSTDLSLNINNTV